MNEIKLDPRKLLGFKIIADGESTVRLTSPKIGDKDDRNSDVAPAVATCVLVIGSELGGRSWTCDQARSKQAAGLQDHR